MKLSQYASSIYKTGVSWSEAMRQAWRIIKLKLGALRGVVKFSYLKKNGEVRHAQTTTPKEYNYKGGKATANSVPYFDLERNAYRSFIPSNLLTVG